MTILKSSKRAAAEDLAWHLVNDDENKTIRFLSAVNVPHLTGSLSDIFDNLEFFEGLAEAPDGKQHLFHLSVSPNDKDGPWSEEDWEAMRHLIEQEFELEGQPFFVVEHEKKIQKRELPHRHFVYSRVQFRDKGSRLAPIHDNWVRNEKIARTFEALYDNIIVKGRHNRQVVKLLEEEALNQDLPKPRRWNAARAFKRIMESGITEGERPTAVMTDSQWRQQKRNGINRIDVVSAAGTFWDMALDGLDCREALKYSRLRLERGHSTLVLVDDAGGRHGLVNAISASLKREGRPRVKRKEVQEVVASLQLNLDETADRQRDSATDKQESIHTRRRRVRTRARKRKPRVRRPVEAVQETPGGIEVIGHGVAVKSQMLAEAYQASFAVEIVRLIRWNDLEGPQPAFDLYSGGRVTDQGEQITSTTDSLEAARVTVAVAKAKGWTEIEVVRGSDEFRARVRAEAEAEGLIYIEPEDYFDESSPGDLSQPDA